MFYIFEDIFYDKEDIFILNMIFDIRIINWKFLVNFLWINFDVEN